MRSEALFGLLSLFVQDLQSGITESANVVESSIEERRCWATASSRSHRSSCAASHLSWLWDLVRSLRDCGFRSQSGFDLFTIACSMLSWVTSMLMSWPAFSP